MRGDSAVAFLRWFGAGGRVDAVERSDGFFPRQGCACRGVGLGVSVIVALALPEENTAFCFGRGEVHLVLRELAREIGDKGDAFYTPPPRLLGSLLASTTVPMPTIPSPAGIVALKLVRFSLGALPPLAVPAVPCPAVVALKLVLFSLGATTPPPTPPFLSLSLLKESR